MTTIRLRRRWKAWATVKNVVPGYLECRWGMLGKDFTITNADYEHRWTLRDGPPLVLLPKDHNQLKLL